MGCPLYSGCLNHSVASGWESFSCQQCPLAAQAPPVAREVGRYANERKGDRFG